MKTKKKPVVNIRIRFTDEVQVSLIRKAALLHSQSFNSFVVMVAEIAAKALADTPPVDNNKVIADAVLKSLPKQRK